MSGERKSGAKPDRTAYQGASIVFGVVAVIFGLWGALASLGDDGGPGSPGFIISVVFVVLGVGRVYLGYR